MAQQGGDAIHGDAYRQKLSGKGMSQPVCVASEILAKRKPAKTTCTVMTNRELSLFGSQTFDRIPSAGRELTTSHRSGLSQVRRPPRGHSENSHIAATALRTPLPIQSLRSAPATLKTTKPPSIQAVTRPSTSARRCVSPQSKLDIHLHTMQKARMAQPSPPARATPTGTFGREPVPHPSKKNIAQTNPIAPRINPTTHGDGAACESPRLLRVCPDGRECAPRMSSTIAPTPISM